MFRLVSLFYEVVPGVLTEQGKVGRCEPRCFENGPCCLEGTLYTPC